MPSQGYTHTEGFHNPCYVCHQAEIPGRENVLNDDGLQAADELSDIGFHDHWLNLFEDRRGRATAITDEEITAWIRDDNYSELPGRLYDAGFEGWIPDLDDLELGAAPFDEHGFAKDGSGRVAFTYKPMPSTFWPTNGATDDVMVRLPIAFRSLADGTESLDVYRANLALLELSIKDRKRMGSLPVVETVVGVDPDGDGELGIVRRVVRREHSVGAASDVPVYDTMYPKGTEFLHTVRYIDVADDGAITHSTRMKEVRYMVRTKEMRRAWAEDVHLEEILEKEFGMLPRHEFHKARRSLESEMGWEISGFIERRDGRLRTQTFEETVFCMGCHNSIRSTIDKTFSWPRKVDGPRGYGYIDLRSMPDASNMTVPGATRIADGEILVYLDRVGGGSEFRANDEMQARYFRPDGTLDVAAVLAAEDVYELLAPLPGRALALNKAYRVLVDDQDSLLGRDAIIARPVNVHADVDPDTAPTLPEDRQFAWDIILDWAAVMDIEETSDAPGATRDRRPRRTRSIDCSRAPATRRGGLFVRAGRVTGSGPSRRRTLEPLQPPIDDERPERYHGADDPEAGEPPRERHLLDPDHHSGDQRHEQDAVYRPRDRHRHRHAGGVLQRHRDEEEQQRRDALDHAEQPQAAKEHEIDRVGGHAGLPEAPDGVTVGSGPRRPRGPHGRVAR